MLSPGGDTGGYSRIAVCSNLTAVASPAVECGLQGLKASVAAARRFSSSIHQALELRFSKCGAWA